MSTSLGEESFRVLLAEDDSAARDLVDSIFEVEGWNPPAHAVDGVEALALMQSQPWDILVSDLNMPRMNGADLIRSALEERPDLTVLVITGNGTIDTAVDLMKAGVYDFITKPFTVERFLTSLRNARERVVSISEIRGIRQVVDALMAALESKDRYLNGHAGRVSLYAVRLGRLVGLDRQSLKILEFAAMLHDVGKIGVHEDILNKPGPLTPEEFEAMKKHPIYSRDILASVPFLHPCLAAVYHHHERLDGKGYPDGIVGEDIPLGARIIAVVDTFDAMNSERSYRPALPIPEILEVLARVAGAQLDAALVDLFLENFEEITEIEIEVPS